MLRQGCSLSMLHRNCEKVHGVLGWVDWVCPISCTCLFILTPGVLRSTLSHIWCKLNLPICLLRVGLLTLMYIDSLIICNKPELFQKEMDHLRKALTHCKYPKWAIDRVERRHTKPTSEESNKSGAIYWFQCGDLAYDEEYIGETSRTFGERFKEHIKEPSPIHNHSHNTVHTTTQDPCLCMCIEPPRTYIRCGISVLPQTW